MMEPAAGAVSVGPSNSSSQKQTQKQQQKAVLQSAGLLRKSGDVVPEMQLSTLGRMSRMLILRPQSTVRVIWDLTTLVFLVYLVFSIPYRLGFDGTLAGLDRLCSRGLALGISHLCPTVQVEKWSPSYWFEAIILDSFFWADLLVRPLRQTALAVRLSFRQANAKAAKAQLDSLPSGPQIRRSEASAAAELPDGVHRR